MAARYDFSEEVNAVTHNLEKLSDSIESSNTPKEAPYGVINLREVPTPRVSKSNDAVLKELQQQRDQDYVYIIQLQNEIANLKEQLEASKTRCKQLELKILKTTTQEPMMDQSFYLNSFDTADETKLLKTQINELHLIINGLRDVSQQNSPPEVLALALAKQKFNKSGKDLLERIEALDPTWVDLYRKLQDLLISLSPSNAYEQARPDTRQIWKWIRTLLQEYMQIKKSGDHYEMLHKIAQICGVTDGNEIVRAVTKLKEDSHNLKTMLWRIENA